MPQTLQMADSAIENTKMQISPSDEVRLVQGRVGVFGLLKALIRQVQDSDGFKEHGVIIRSVLYSFLNGINETVKTNKGLMANQRAEFCLNKLPKFLEQGLGSDYLVGHIIFEFTNGCKPQTPSY